jgi:hypothetical protein
MQTRRQQKYKICKQLTDTKPQSILYKTKVISLCYGCSLQGSRHAASHNTSSESKGVQWHRNHPTSSQKWTKTYTYPHDCGPVWVYYSMLYGSGAYNLGGFQDEIHCSEVPQVRLLLVMRQHVEGLQK